VRLFAALRELAGASRVESEGRTVGEVADAISLRYGERFASIAAASSFVVNGERADRGTVLADGDEMAILPPVSGGAAGSGRAVTRTAASRPSARRS
jgi:molybdopterin synthase catalytic subunit